MSDFYRKSPSRFFLVVLAVAVLFGNSCVHQDYIHRSRHARRDFQGRDFEKALSWYQKQRPPARDRLLYLLDQGIILHTAGRFQESMTVFNQAIELSEQKEGPQILSKTATLVATDNLIPYQGEKFELLLLHVFQVLNYLGLEKGDDALVEVRRIHTKFPDFFKEGAKDFLQNAFAAYLSGLVWESQNKLNDAYIDYKITYRMQPAFPPLAQNLLKDSYYFGFLNDYRRWTQIFKKEYPPQLQNNGEVIVIVEEGTVPEKESTEEEYNLQFLPVPVYPRFLGEPIRASVMVEGKEVAKTYPLFRPDEAAKKTLEEQKPAIIARGLARLAAKETGAVLVGEKIDRDLGIFFGFLLLTTNRADLRSWLTLPRSLQIAQFSLPAGTYDLKLSWPGSSHLFSKIQVLPGKKRFLTYRIF